jgi:hypothetical protein
VPIPPIIGFSFAHIQQLNSIDNLRVDGKFMVGSDIPDGQAAVVALLEDCFELTYELKAQAEESAEAEDVKVKDEAIHVPAETTV